MYDDDAIQQIIRGYYEDTKMRFKDMLENEGFSEEDQEIAKRLLGYSIAHSKDYLTVQDAYIRGGQ